MKRFLVLGNRTSYRDDFNEGQSFTSTGFSDCTEELIKAETWREAVKKFIEMYLEYEIDGDFGDEHVDEDGDWFSWATLTKVDLTEPTQEEIALWAEGSLSLYSQEFSISVSEVVSLNLKEA